MQDSSGLRYFTWDQNGMNLLCERDSAGAVTAYYTHGFAAVDGIGSPVAVKQNRFGAAYFQYPGYDHKGNLTVVTDENGNKVAKYNYTANGVTLTSEVTGGISETRLGYQTNWIRLQDAPFDMYASPTRLEVPAYGVFLGRDPKKRLAGSCDYACCDANPVGNVDPDGRETIEVDTYRGNTFYWEDWSAKEKELGATGYSFTDSSHSGHRKIQISATLDKCCCCVFDIEKIDQLSVIHVPKVGITIHGREINAAQQVALIQLERVHIRNHFRIVRKYAKTLTKKATCCYYENFFTWVWRIGEVRRLPQAEKDCETRAKRLAAAITQRLKDHQYYIGVDVFEKYLGIQYDVWPPDRHDVRKYAIAEAIAISRINGLKSEDWDCADTYAVWECRAKPSKSPSR